MHVAAAYLRALTAAGVTVDDAAALVEFRYAATDEHEYWAEGVQSWFDTNRENDAIHNHVDTREELLEYDPALIVPNPRRSSTLYWVTRTEAGTSLDASNGRGAHSTFVATTTPRPTSLTSTPPIQAMSQAKKNSAPISRRSSALR